MNIAEKVFGKEIERRISAKVNTLEKSISQILGFSVGAAGGKPGKYSDAGNSSSLYADAYKDDLYIYGCVYLISNTIAHIPLVIYKDDTKKEVIEEHPLYELLKTPNFKDSEFDIKESISANLELTGNAYLLLDKRENNGIPGAIFSLLSSKVVPKRKQGVTKVESLSDILESYIYGQMPYKIEDILHERKFSITDDIIGMSPIQAGALTVDSAIESKKQNFRVFKQGMNPGGTLESEQQFSPEAYNRLRLDLKEKYTGTENAHIPMILFNGLKYNQIGLSNKDIEYINGLKMSREEICGFLYQVPLILLGVLENSSYNNIKEATKIFYNFSILPRLVKNRELWQKLLDLYKNKNYYIDFDTSGVDALKEDITERVNRAKNLWSMGVPVETLNEMYELGIEEYTGWNNSYIPMGLIPTSNTNEPVEPGEEQNPKAQTESFKKKKLKKISWTEEMKVSKWKKFNSETQAIETHYKNALAKFFKEQEKEVVNNLSKYKSITSRKVSDKTFIILGEIEGKAKAIRVESVLFDTDGQVKKLKKVSIPYHAQALKTQGEAEIENLGLDIAFDVQNPQVIAWLTKNALNKSVEVTGTIRSQLKEVLIEGVNAGESIEEIQDRVINFYAEKGYDIPEGYSIDRIARTEIIGASNQGALESYDQAGVEKKAWLATRDDRARKIGGKDGIEFHVAMEEKYADGIAIDDDFVDEYTGGIGQAPGQMGTAEDDINCRCTIIPIIED